jgi:hypothetical protein
MLTSLLHSIRKVKGIMPSGQTAKIMGRKVRGNLPGLVARVGLLS